jgi:hypothetical protein
MDSRCIMSPASRKIFILAASICHYGQLGVSKLLPGTARAVPGLLSRPSTNTPGQHSWCFWMLPAVSAASWSCAIVCRGHGQPTRRA